MILIRVKREAVAAAVRGVSVIATHDVAYWHKADNATAPAFVRFWTTADKFRFRPAEVCRLKTQIGQRAAVQTKSGSVSAEWLC